MSYLLTAAVATGDHAKIIAYIIIAVVALAAAIAAAVVAKIKK